MSEEIFMPSEIVFRGVDELLPYAKNSREHSSDQVNALAANIKATGWTNPCLIADGGILAGHGRIMAAKKLGLTRVPCIDLSHLSEVERRALVISDNRLSELATWSLSMLKDETDWLQEQGFDLELTGFDEDSLAELLGELEQLPLDDDKDPDEAPATPEQPVSVLGDVWCMGEHRLVVGDCTDLSIMDRLMNGEVAQAAWLDPPYRVNQERKNKEQDKWDGGNRSRSGGVLNDKMSDADFLDFLRSAFASVFAMLKPGAPIYITYPDSEAENFLRAFRESGFKRQSILAWVKNVQTLGRADHQSRTENIAYGWKPGAAHPWHGGRKVTNVVELGNENPFHQLNDGRWQISIGDKVMIVSGDVQVETHPTDAIYEPRPARSDLHPTMKPANLVARTLRNSTLPGDIVLDAFGGSGTTMIAAEQLGLKARLCELSPAFADVICRRYWHYSGKRPVNALTGELFPEEGGAREAICSQEEIGDQVEDIF